MHFWRAPGASLPCAIPGRCLPAGIDAHKAISLVTINFFASLILQCDVDVVALIFEASDRGDSLVKRDYDLASMDLKNMRGHRVEVEGCFMPKASMEPGLEVADLIVHTAGRQRRHEMAGKRGHTKDFQQTYWHSPIPPKFMAISAIEIAQGVAAGQFLACGAKANEKTAKQGT